MSAKVSNPPAGGASRQYSLSAAMITVLRRLHKAEFTENDCFYVTQTLLALDKRGLIVLRKGPDWHAKLSDDGAFLFPEIGG